MMQKAMKDAGMDSGKNAGKPAENALLAQYFSVLLASENYELMLTESDKYVNDPKCPWFVFSDRGVAKAALGDPAGAVAEFNTAMDRASVEPGRMRPMVVVQSISATKSLGLHKAIELVLARAKDNPMWQMIAAELLLSDHDLKGATAQAESAMVSIDKLTPADQFYLMHLTSGLYTNASPPVVDKALELYRKMLKIQPDNYEAMNDMACILCDMSVPPKPAEALVWSQKAYDLCLKNGQIPPRVADTQGWVLMQNDKVTQGIEVLHNAIDQANFPDAHYHLAMGFIKQKAFGNARFELDLAAQMLARDEGQKTQVDPSLKAKIDAAREAAKGDGATPAGKT
jgi:tetratricopeptide (TPR) repeat protein